MVDMQHIADYLAERTPDHEGDIAVILTPAIRDEIVRSVNSLPGLVKALEDIVSLPAGSKAGYAKFAQAQRIASDAISTFRGSK